MTTPICDFVNKYSASSPVRLHMPGHKGACLTGPEAFDITEIDGADDLFHPAGIIKESEENASCIFDSHTFYSCEGSSLSIRGMLYLARTYSESSVILASRNAHKVFLTACGLLDMDIKWIHSESNSLLFQPVTPKSVKEALNSLDEPPCAVYITSPDYLGGIADICGIAQVCKRYNVPLLVDNAHGAYLNFLGMHPIKLGADMCADSAHKTLPCLTGASYLHVSKNAPEYFFKNAKNALSVFASTSPSYLILQSLDKANEYLESLDLSAFAKSCDELKSKLISLGFELYGDEPLKITVCTKFYGYLATEVQDYLKEHNIFAEFADKDFLVLMLSPFNDDIHMDALYEALKKLPARPAINEKPFDIIPCERVLSVREALFKPCEVISVSDSLGRICAVPAVSCPPAIPIVCSGERISQNAIDAFKYYGIERISVIK